MRERLGQLQVEYHDGRELRILQADQEQPSEVSDGDFYSSFVHETRQAESALLHSYEAMEAAKSTCLEHGIDPDEYRPARSEPDAIQLENASLLETIEIPDTPSTLEPAIPPPAAWPLLTLSEFRELNESSGILTSMSGPPHSDVRLPRRGSQDNDHTRGRIEDWMDDLDISSSSSLEDEQIEEREDANFETQPEIFDTV